MTKSQLAKKLGVSRTYITLLAQGKRQPSQQMVNKMSQLGVGDLGMLSNRNRQLSGNTSQQEVDVSHTTNVDHYGLQTRWGALSVSGGFDTHPLPPGQDQYPQTSENPLVMEFIKSRRQGLSPRSLDYYWTYLNLSSQVVGINIAGQEITDFLRLLQCPNGGERGYYCCLRAFYNWLYSPKSGYNLNRQNNPILLVDPPKVEKKTMPSLSSGQIDYLIEQAGCLRDKAIISLFADSGLRLTELATIKTDDIDWHNGLIKVWCKGNREGYAPFGQRTKMLMKEWLSHYQSNGKLWDLNRWGIIEMLKQLRAKTGLPCNAHTFRRTFASILAKKGVDSLHIMRLGRWESIAMVERYTRSVSFEDSLKLYKEIKS